jgi:O-antigen/teichoic acid export membrane protein
MGVQHMAQVLEAAVERPGREECLTLRQTIRARLLGGVGWSAVGAIVSQGCSFLTSVLLARVLGRQTFGRFALIQSTAVALTGVSGLGLSITATKYVSQYRASDPAKAGRILGLSAWVTMLAGVCFTAGLLFWARLGFTDRSSPADLRAGLEASAAYVFFITVSTYQVGALSGFEAFRKIAAINAVYGIATLGISLALATRYGLIGAVWGQSAGAVLLWLLYQAAVARHCRRRQIPIQYGEGWRERRILFEFAFPAAACGIVSCVATWAANVLLVRFAGYAELAIFSAVLSMRSMVLFTPALIVRVTNPVLNSLSASGDIQAYQQILWRTVALNGLIALFPAAALSLLGPLVLRCFGSSFRGSPWIAPLLLASVILEVVSNNLFQALFTAGRISRHLSIVCTWAAVLLGAATLGTRRHGAAGLAGAYLVAWFVAVGLYLGAAIRHMRR